MKRVMTFLLAFLVASLTLMEAQNFKYFSTDFAYKTLNSYGRWTDWSDWEDSHCLVNINLDREEIHIYSEEPQEFTIYDYSDDTTYDSDGGEQFELSCIDSEGIRCTVRLRTTPSGTMQLYVDYSNLMLVYNLEER